MKVVCKELLFKSIESSITNLDPNWIQWFIGVTDVTQKKYNSTLSKRQTPVNNLPSELKEIIYGCLLGDLYYQKANINNNVRLMFMQGKDNKEYM